MKRINRFVALILLLAGCAVQPAERKSYIEAQPSFAALRHGSWIDNAWIRRPEHLLMVHATFKTVGYKRLIGDLLADKPLLMHGIYINKTGRELIDSLIMTYDQPEKASKYYSEFWKRRMAEANEKVVYQILTEISRELHPPLEPGLPMTGVKMNDTLFQLLEIEFRSEPLTESLAHRDFQTLRRLGFHQSAYNLLEELYRYQDLHWDRARLEKELKPTTAITYAWFEDDTK